MKLLNILIRLLTISTIYILSLYVFKSTSFYAEIESNLKDIFNFNVAVNVAITLLVVIAFFRKSSTHRFIYLSSIFLCLPAFFGYVKFNWINIFLYYYEYSTSLSVLSLTLVGLLILGASVLLYYNASYERTAQEFVVRGIPESEIKHIILRQIALYLFVLFFVGIIIAIFTSALTFMDQALTSLAISLNPVVIAGISLIPLLILGIIIIRSISTQNTGNTEIVNKNSDLSG